MVYTFAINSGLLTLTFDLEAESRAEALEIARSALDSYVDFRVTSHHSRRLKSCTLRVDVDVTDSDIIDEWSGVTSVRAV
jgi:hypothetical protein